MAAFKVGQRVRIVGPIGYADFQHYIGTETVITHGPFASWVTGDECWGIEAYEGGCAASNLAPLTDPGAESFIARIKKLGSEPVNAVEKEGVK